MKKSNKGKLFVLVGMAFIFLAAGFLIFNFISIYNANQYNEKICKQIIHYIPEQSDVIFDEYSCSEMPVMEIDGNDYCFILEVPRYDVKLPVLNERQNKNNVSPYQYVNDNSLAICCSGGNGQFGFLNYIETDDTLTLTDMNGNRYSFIVENIQMTDKPDFESLVSDNACLTLLAKNTWNFNYMIVQFRSL